MIQNQSMIAKYNGVKANERTYRVRNNMKRIYVRGLMLGCLVLLILTFGAFGMGQFGDQDAFAASESTDIQQKSIVVEQGDSLWAIASEHAKNGQDLREYVHQLKKVNGLKSSTLHEGQKLLIP